MPPKRKRTAYAAALSSRYEAAKKRRYAYRKSNITPRIMVQTGAGPLPSSMITTLRYCSTVLSDGTNFDTEFNLNSLLLAELLVAGSQPLGRDQFLTFYNRYRVLKCRVKLIGAVNNAVSTDNHIIGVLANNTSGVYTDINTPTEQQGAWQDVIGPSTTSRFIRTYDLAKINGVTMAEYKADDRFQAVFTASPSEFLRLHVLYAKAATTVALAQAVRIRVQLDFTVELFDLQSVARSS